MNFLRVSIIVGIFLSTIIFSSSSFGLDIGKLREKARQGDAKAQARMGAIYTLGEDGVTKDFKEAFKWWKLAAEQGYAEAQFQVGAHYLLDLGSGVPTDKKEALKWLKLSADQGYKKAIKWYKVTRDEENVDYTKRRTLDGKLVKTGKKRPRADKKALEGAKSGNLVEQQENFLEIVSSSIPKYKKAKNQIKKSLLRKKRMNSFKNLFDGEEIKSKDSYPGKSCKDVCIHVATTKNGFDHFTASKNCTDQAALLLLSGQGCDNWRMNPTPTGNVNNKSRNWVGKVKSLSTDKDGDATVDIKLTNDITLRDSEISSTHSIYESLGELEEDGKATFSGRFQVHNDAVTSGYFLQTTNMTEGGAMTDPTFIFKLESISPIE
jgi:hypothetical protein